MSSSPPLNRLENKVALITGAASGLGAASARRLHREGALVVITDRTTAPGEALSAELGDRSLFIPLDVTQEPQWISALDATLARFGRLDVLVNNAGVGVVADIEETTLEQWRAVHAVNTEGVFLGCKHGIRAMKAQGSGSIINLSSVAALTGSPTLAAYSSSKGAVLALTRTAAIHCARKGYGIRCNSLHPVFIETPMVDAMLATSKDPEKARANLARSIPLGRLGVAEDVAAAVAYLASDDARFITGVELPIDGGFMAQ